MGCTLAINASHGIRDESELDNDIKSGLQVVKLDFDVWKEGMNTHLHLSTTNSV
jgi:hypothetical protein